ncbi:MAG: hypothetical protein ACYDC1_20190 [Limisphaerales bacterium]
MGAELVIPAAETWVIGDTIPLYWRFKNQTSEPLAFMWEGCCRLNGRLAVTLQGGALDPIPPGQALAHMFAKAERLLPGQARDFDTRLSDWVLLTNRGTYQLQGRYIGVLPSQQPQVPKGTALWREAATTAPIEVSVVTVADYQAQRMARAERRGLALALDGPETVPPLGSTTLRLTIRNRGSTPAVLAWPDDVQMWIVDSAGLRVALSSVALDDKFEELTVLPAGSLTREIAVTSDHFEGEVFGDYRLFLDLQPDRDGRPRVPSNAIPIRWRLGPAEVTSLLEKAVGGQRPGARNVPLRLLRVYVAELGPTFETLPPASLSREAVSLVQQLRLAARLKPLEPKPGRVDWTLEVASDGHLRFEDERLAGLVGEPTLEALASLLGVRRHLGWEVFLRFEPAAEATVATVLAASSGFAPLAGDLAGPPRFTLEVPNATNRLAMAVMTLVPPPAPPPVILHLRREGGGVGLTGSRPSQAADAPETKALDGTEATGEFVGDRSEVELNVAGDLPWAELLTVARPILARGVNLHLRTGGISPPSGRTVSPQSR